MKLFPKQHKEVIRDKINRNASCQHMDNDRLQHLDSLRGIAAMAVALLHSLWPFSISYSGNLGVFLGVSPVYFFFLLSGYVLSRSLFSKDIHLTHIVLYYIRRVFRLYPAAVIALLFGLFVVQLINVSDFQSVFHYDFSYHIIKSKSINFSEFFDIILLLNISPNSPLWTIQVEFICSFLLPFLILPVKRYPILAMPLTIVLTVLAWRSEVGQLPEWLKYPLLFFLGALIFKARLSLKTISTQTTKWLFFLLSLMFIFSIKSGYNTVVLSLILSGYLAIFVPCNWICMKKILGIFPLLFLGRISYSFYLTHMPFLQLTLLVLLFIFPDFIHYNSLLISFLCFVLSVSVAIVFSALMERYIERPFNQMGHYITNIRMSQKIIPEDKL